MTDEADRLSFDDARILALESAALTGHTLKLMILQPGAALDLDALRRSVSARLPAQPRATECVELGIAGDAPRWVPTEQFDIADHVRRRAGTEVATLADLRRTVSELMSEHLPRDRPLWTLDLIGPMADGREAIAARLHHAMVDGIAGMQFLESILLESILLEATVLEATVLESIVLDSHDAPMHPAAATATARQSFEQEMVRMPAAAWRELGHPGTRSPFDRPVTAARALSFTSARLDALKNIGASRPAHATVNDVLLAVVAGGLHTWLGGVHAGRYLRAQVPVSLHHRDEGDSVGNRDSFINVDLPLAETHPLRRLDHISAQTRTEKQQGDAALLYDLFHALDQLTPAAEFVHRLAGSPREFSVAISNVPGPRMPVSVAGRRVEQLFTSSEPAAHHALRISAISNATEVGIGFCTDPTALGDIEALAVAVAASFDELHVAALGAAPIHTV